MAKCSKCSSPVCKCGPLHYGESPVKQVGNIDPLTGLPITQMTNVPPQQGNTLGNAQPLFNPQAQQVANGVFGDINQRQYGAPLMFEDQTGDGKITQADVIKARTEGYKK